MVRPPESSHLEEDLEEEDDDQKPCYGEEFTPHHDSSPQKGKLDGKRGSVSTPRSKHSETEQRRRSKINERFQILRDLIPQSDQRRDKASFLLEVIDYIHFLQEKVQMYEGLYHQGYNQEPTKLTPWRNNSWTEDNHVEPAPVMRNDIENPAVPLQMRSEILAPVGTGDLSGAAQQHLRDVGDMVSHPQPQWWPAMPFAADYAAMNNSQNQHEQLDIEKGSESLSSAYSQGILNTLTKALQNSGVDLSQASISVQIDVGKRASSGATSTSSSKDHENHQRSIPAAAFGGDGSCGERPDQQHHRG